MRLYNQFKKSQINSLQKQKMYSFNARLGKNLSEVVKPNNFKLPPTLMHVTRNPTLNRYKNLIIHQKNNKSLLEIRKLKNERAKDMVKWNLIATSRLAKLRALFNPQKFITEGIQPSRSLKLFKFLLKWFILGQLLMYFGVWAYKAFKSYFERDDSPGSVMLHKAKSNINEVRSVLKGVKS